MADHFDFEDKPPKSSQDLRRISPSIFRHSYFTRSQVGSLRLSHLQFDLDPITDSGSSSDAGFCLTHALTVVGGSPVERRPEEGKFPTDLSEFGTVDPSILIKRELDEDLDEKSEEDTEKISNKDLEKALEEILETTVEEDPDETSGDPDPESDSSSVHLSEHLSISSLDSDMANPPNARQGAQAINVLPNVTKLESLTQPMPQLWATVRGP
ncbi:hypothetical protein O6H91_01G129200 [Diphasiastrum complanatum]|uniref:Uncharacterized protein n=1 Tax=Diphasiastrum complanatum TaxID=34168 RepID=A0ACC2EVQ3_DIPCM|nr:hypothetical protein O6H91_01G129200 [Diphasiastrum complanatum]